MNKVEVEDPIANKTSTESASETSADKFDYYINGLITYPKKLVGKTNIHTVSINGSKVDSLIDTGSQVSIISHNLYCEFFNYLTIEPLEKILNLKGVTGNQLDYEGYVDLFVTPGEKLAGIPFDCGVHVSFIVVKDADGLPKTHGNATCIIGMNAVEDIWRHYGDVAKPSQLDFAFNGLTSAAKYQEESIGKLKLTKEITIPPKSDAILKCSLRSKKVTGCTAPILINMELDMVDNQDLVVSCDLSPYAKIKIPIRNNMDSTIVLEEGVVIASAFLSPLPFSSEEVDFKVSRKLLETDEVFKPKKHNKTETHFVKDQAPNMDDEEEELTPDMQQLYDFLDNTHKDDQRVDGLPIGLSLTGGSGPARVWGHVKLVCIAHGRC